MIREVVRQEVVRQEVNVGEKVVVLREMWQCEANEIQKFWITWQVLSHSFKMNNPN
jgi:hypothetical protein